VTHIDEDLKEICKKIQQNHVDYPIISSHYFRHTFACKATRKNISLMHLLKICGWSNAQMLSKVYGHMTPQQSLDIINLIPPITYKGGFKS
jgi:integrase